MKRLIVFGVDSLRPEAAEILIEKQSPGISRLNAPMSAWSGGALSVTQTEWASVWSGMPNYYHHAHDNNTFEAMPDNMHIMRKLMYNNELADFFPVWITGKGHNIMGNIPESPHWQVYDAIINQGHAGVYYGDLKRTNGFVFNLAKNAINKAAAHADFCCFIHFKDPDDTGHATESWQDYIAAAHEVDNYVGKLMDLAPHDTEFIYCSDHGFNFIELGEVETNHFYAPEGILATSFDTLFTPDITRQSIGRLIYRFMGGNPDRCTSDDSLYSMYGVDLI